MNKALRDNVQELANDSLSIIRKSLLEGQPMSDKIKEAIRIVNLGIKAGHLDQMSEHAKASIALRLIPHLPKDVDRDEYVKITNPQIRPLMLKGPKK
jgi:hypothetical protein